MVLSSSTQLTNEENPLDINDFTRDEISPADNLSILFAGKPYSWRLSEPGVAEIVATVASERGVKTVYSVAPTVFGGKVVEGAFCPVLEGQRFINLPVPFRRHPGSLVNGAIVEDVEGVVLERGEAAFVSTADSATVIVEGGDGRVTVFHAGLRSVVLQDGGGVWHPGESRVVEAAIARTRGISRVSVVGATTRLRYDPIHPEHGLSNKRLISSLKGAGLGVAITDEVLGIISIAELVRLRLATWGIECKILDGYDPSDMSNRPLFWSRGHGEEGLNGILVMFLP